jgi:hypothetical protein
MMMTTSIATPPARESETLRQLPLAWGSSIYFTTNAAQRRGNCLSRRG